MRRAAADPADTAALASSAERSGDWDAAFAAYQRLFSYAIGARRVEIAADALRGLSRACQQRSRLEEAEEFAVLSFEIADRTGHVQAAARAVNTLAAIRFLEGGWRAAADLYARSLERATDCGDDALIGWTCQNLGVLANLEGDLPKARALYLESVASSARSGDMTTSVAAYNSLGMISSDLGEWSESLLYFERGLEIATQLGDVETQATLLANRAEPLAHLGECQRALETLRQAEGLAAPIGCHRVLAEVFRFRGTIARMQRRLSDAEELIVRARDIAVREGFPLEEAEATEELARLRWIEGRAGAARATAREALRTFEGLSAGHDVRRIRALLVDWSTSAAG